MARAIQADAVRTHQLLAWIVMQDEVPYPGKFVARLVTDAPREVVEIWFLPAG